MTKETPALIDTHAHLDDEQFSDDLTEVVGRASAAGVDQIVNVGYRPARWKTTLALANRFPHIRYALGLHPHHADEWSDETESELLRLLRIEQPLALGEIGLDYFRNLTPPELQKIAFRRQLQIASEMKLPVIIHQRAAESDLIDILKETPADLVCVLHSFDGTHELASFAFDRGYLLGVGGLMTRKSADAVREIVRDYPLDRLLLETDSPYLVPSGLESRRNEPANIAVIAGDLAELRGVPLASVERATTESARRVFPALLSATATT